MNNRDLYELIKEEVKRRIDAAPGQMRKGEAVERLLTEIGMGAAFLIGLLPSDKSRMELFQSWAQHVATEAQQQGSQREAMKGIIGAHGKTIQ